MNSKTWNIYVGLPINIDRETETKVIELLNDRHPDCELHSIVEGYWSGVEENTLLIKVTSAEEKAQETANIIKSLLGNGFVALDEQED
ncbi:MAG: hypothetical protein V4611_04230 [Patescibacteria group bacterium]